MYYYEIFKSKYNEKTDFLTIYKQKKMRTKMILIVIALIALSCKETPKETSVVNDEFFINGSPGFYQEAPKPSGAAFGVRPDGKGKPKGNVGKPQRTINFKPSINSPVGYLQTTRIMEEPVAYTGALPTEQTVDWDNDGILDEVILNQRCYFPRTFVEVFVNGEVVSYNVSYYARIIGFTDVDADGFTDIIFEGGNSRDYNNGEAHSQYNVGFNRSGASPTSLKDIVQSLVISSADTNPDYIKWDLSAYGYNHFTFHVFLFNKTQNDGYALTQTTTYGEWGFYSAGRIIVGDVYVLRFTNLGDDCSDIEVEFTL